jgi:hypothetical protein
MTTLIKTLRLFVTLSLFCLIAADLSAQKSIQEIAELKDKKWDKLVKSHKSGINSVYAAEGLIDIGVLDEARLPDPKNAGVLTFQLWDESVTKYSKYGNWAYKNYLTPTGSNIISNKLIETMLPEIKKLFNDSGISLLEPNEFATSEEKQKIYNEGPEKIELSGILKVFSGGLLDRLQGKRKGQGTLSADGYAFYPITASLLASDFKAPAKIGLVTEELDLDASLIISVKVSIEKGGKALMFRGMELALIGPIDDDESIEYSGRIGAKTMNTYREGLLYSAAYFEFDDIQIAKMNKKNGAIEEWYLDGFPKMSRRLTSDLLYGLEKFKNLDKKK